jgi:hypothetical protein
VFLACLFVDNLTPYTVSTAFGMASSSDCADRARPVSRDEAGWRIGTVLLFGFGHGARRLIDGALYDCPPITSRLSPGVAFRVANLP